MAKVRTKVPDGKGGWAEVEGEAVAGGAADLEKQRKALREEFYAGAGGLTEQFWKYGRLHAQESNLSDDQIAFAQPLQDLGADIVVEPDPDLAWYGQIVLVEHANDITTIAIHVAQGYGRNRQRLRGFSQYDKRSVSSNGLEPPRG